MVWIGAKIGMNEARRDREVFYFLKKIASKFSIENLSSKLTFELKAPVNFTPYHFLLSRLTILLIYSWMPIFSSGSTSIFHLIFHGNFCRSFSHLILMMSKSKIPINPALHQKSNPPLNPLKIHRFLYFTETLAFIKFSVLLMLWKLLSKLLFGSSEVLNLSWVLWKVFWRAVQ